MTRLRGSSLCFPIFKHRPRIFIQPHSQRTDARYDLRVQQQMVKLNFKVLSNEQSFELEVVTADLGTAGQLRKLAAEKAGLTVADVQLVRAGQIILDDKSLESLALAEGDIIHIAVNQPKPETIPSSAPTLNMAMGLEGMGLGGIGGLMGMNPLMLAGMMDQVTPEMIHQTLQAYPFLKIMAASNPQLSAIINNPQILKQAMTTMDPASMQAAMSQFGNSGGLVPVPPPSATVPKEHPYGDQLQKLREMGFADDELSLKALEESKGDIQAATLKLMNL